MSSAGAGIAAPTVRRRLRGDRRVWIALGVLAAIVLTAVFAPLLAPYDPRTQLDIAHLQSQPPSLAHPLGTDTFSRDVLSRLIYGTRVSLAVALVAVSISITFGTLLGAVAGYVGGAIDAVLMRFVDAAFSIPTLLLLIVVIALWGDISVVSLTLLIAGVGWFTVSRLVRAETLAVRDADYVVAARALGVPGWRSRMARTAECDRTRDCLRDARGGQRHSARGRSFLSRHRRPAPHTQLGQHHRGGGDSRLRCLVAHAVSGSRHSRDGLRVQCARRRLAGCARPSAASSGARRRTFRIEA